MKRCVDEDGHTRSRRGVEMDREMILIECAVDGTRRFGRNRDFVLVKHTANRTPLLPDRARVVTITRRKRLDPCAAPALCAFDKCGAWKFCACLLDALAERRIAREQNERVLLRVGAQGCVREVFAGAIVSVENERAELI